MAFIDVDGSIPSMYQGWVKALGPPIYGKQSRFIKNFIFSVTKNMIIRRKTQKPGDSLRQSERKVICNTDYCGAPRCTVRSIPHFNIGNRSWCYVIMAYIPKKYLGRKLRCVLISVNYITSFRPTQSNIFLRVISDIMYYG